MIKKISAVFILLFIFSCAGQVPPSGGEVDRTSPEVVEVYPNSGTTNYSKDYVEIKFSEYVDKRSVQDAIFISPAVEGDIEYDWSGKNLKVKFDEALTEDRTYIITVGTDVKDINNSNKMAQAYNFVFSTGDVIDDFKIFGKVYAKSYEGIIIGAYLLDEEVDPAEEKPDYISQAGADGNYKLLGLKEGNYRVFAIQDKYRDLIYNKMEDKIGLPFTEVQLNESDSLFRGLDFQLTQEDTIPPEITSAVMTDKNHIQIEFNEAVDSSKISAENFFIYDSSESVQHDVALFYKGNSGNNKFFLSFNELNKEAEEQLFLIAKNIYDRSGNVQLETTSSFVVSDKPDTTSPGVSKIDTKLGGNLADTDSPELVIYFDDGIKTDSLSKSIQVLDNEENTLPKEVRKIDDASLLLKVNKTLKPNLDYQIKIDLNYFSDAAGNSYDSVYTYRFKTITGLEFSGASGTVNVETKYPVYLILENVKPDNKYIIKANDSHRFEFTKIQPGEYLLWSFIDEDSSGNYSFGSVEPFKFSERFSYYPDTLNLRARWPVGDITINY